MLKLNIESKSATFTEKLGMSFANRLTGEETVLFSGNLGAGKTTFIRGIALGLGVENAKDVTSPTFNILNIYKGKFYIYHWDMYRISCEDELYDLGFFDYIGKGVTLVEWSENIKEFLSEKEKIVEVDIERIGDDTRLLSFKGIYDPKV